MNAEYLDNVLTKVNNARSGSVAIIFSKDFLKNELMSALNYLEGEGYIGQAKYSTTNLTSWSVSIREEGQVFLANGGYTHAKEVRDSSLNANVIAVESNRIAKQSMAVAFVALILSLVAVAIAYLEYIKND